MAASVSGTSTNTGAAAATATCLLTFAQSSGDIIEAWIRGSANASATVAGVYDNAFGSGQLQGSGSTATVLSTITTYTAGQLVGLSLAITNASDTTNFNVVRTITANTTNTITVSPAFPGVPVGGSAYVVGNTWSALSTWQIDGGAATSHGGWWHATGVLAATGSTVTVTVVWGGGNTAFTLDVLGVTGGATGTTPETVGTTGNGNSASAVAPSLTTAVSGLLLLGVEAVTTAQTYSSELDNAAGNSLTQQLPAAGTSRALVASRAEVAGSYSARATISTSEGWAAGAIFIPDAGAVSFDPSTFPWIGTYQPPVTTSVVGF